MVHCNIQLLMHVSILLLLMQAEPVKWAGWVATEADDLAQLVDEQLHEVADWDNNLKALKVRTKAISQRLCNTTLPCRSCNEHVYALPAGAKLCIALLCSDCIFQGPHCRSKCNFMQPHIFAQYSCDSVPACLQTSARDAEKLPNEVHIGCYSINVQPVKAAIERQMKDLRQELLASLRRKVMPQFFELAHPIMHPTHS